MTVLERKALAIRQILDFNDQDFERVERLLNTLNSTPPCQETVKEMREGVLRATQDYREDKNMFTHEEVKARFSL